MGKRALSAMGLLCAIGACSPDEPVAPEGVAERDDDVKRTSALAGEYADDAVERPDNLIYEASLRPDATFTIFVRGLIDCETPNHECPMSWRRDGKRAGYTIITGKWSVRSSSLSLGDTTLEIVPSSDASTLKLSGAFTASLTTRALYAKSHAVTDAELGGEWRVTNEIDSEGMQAYLSGPRYPVEGREHTVAFDAKTHSFVERLAGETKPVDEGTFIVAGRPSGRGHGVVVLRGGATSKVAIIAKSTDSELDLEVPGATLHLRRTP